MRWLVFCFTFLLLFLCLQTVEAGASYKYTEQWGQQLGYNDVPKTNDGFFNMPHGVAFDKAGNFYVMDTGNNRIQKFSSTGKFIMKWGSKGSGPGQFNNSQGIAIDKDNNVYVVDTGNTRIQKFTSEGTFIAQWGSFGYKDGQFLNPTAIAVDKAGNVFVTDNKIYVVQKFSSTGTFIKKWGSKGSQLGELTDPSGVAVDASGNVYVADYSDINKYTSDGNFLIRWSFSRVLSTDPADQIGLGLDQPEAQAIAVDNSGSIFVADNHNSKVMKFSSSGETLSQWGSQGPGEGLFKFPAGVAVDTSGQVLVADTFNNLIQKFSPITVPDTPVNQLVKSIDGPGKPVNPIPIIENLSVLVLIPLGVTVVGGIVVLWLWYKRGQKRGEP